VSAVNEPKNIYVCIITKNALDQCPDLSAALCCFCDERVWNGTIARVDSAAWPLYSFGLHC